MVKDPRKTPSRRAAAEDALQSVEEDITPEEEEKEYQDYLDGQQAELLLEQARHQAEMIVRDAAQRAQEEYSATMHRAEMEAETLRAQAVQEGRAEGARTQVETIRTCIAGLEASISAMEGSQAGFVTEYEQNLQWVALEIASKLMNKKIQTDDAEMLELVKGAVNSVSGAKWISVEVSSEMPHLLEQLTECLQTASANKKADVRPINAPYGTCLVETPEGIVDASLYKQIENLKEYFAAQQ